MATHSSILAWEISWTEEPGGLVCEVVRVRHDLTTKPPQPLPFSSFWTSNNANVSMLDVVPEFSLNSFFEFLKNVQLGRFPLFCLLIHSSVSSNLFFLFFKI